MDWILHLVQTLCRLKSLDDKSQIVPFVFRLRLQGQSICRRRMEVSLPPVHDKPYFPRILRKPVLCRRHDTGSSLKAQAEQRIIYSIPDIDGGHREGVFPAKLQNLGKSAFRTFPRIRPSAQLSYEAIMPCGPFVLIVLAMSAIEPERRRQCRIAR
jgi:hypothetical protein